MGPRLFLQDFPSREQEAGVSRGLKGLWHGELSGEPELGVLLGSPKLQAKHRGTVGWATNMTLCVGPREQFWAVRSLARGWGRYSALFFPGCVALVSPSTALSLSPHPWRQKGMPRTHGLS